MWWGYKPSTCFTLGSVYLCKTLTARIMEVPLSWVNSLKFTVLNTQLVASLFLLIALKCFGRGSTKPKKAHHCSMHSAQPATQPIFQAGEIAFNAHCYIYSYRKRKRGVRDENQSPSQFLNIITQEVKIAATVFSDRFSQSTNLTLLLSAVQVLLQIRFKTGSFTEGVLLNIIFELDNNYNAAFLLYISRGCGIITPFYWWRSWGTASGSNLPSWDQSIGSSVPLDCSSHETLSKLLETK